jgi:protein-tyrosine phosphatase
MYMILMVCTGNICRSPMAAGLASHFLPRALQDSVQVTSAGISALHGNPAEPHAQVAMSRIGIDISSHQARQLTGELAGAADLILTMEIIQRQWVRHVLSRDKGKVRLLTDLCPRSQTPDIKDPYGGPLSAYQACLDKLLPCVKALITWLETGGDIPAAPFST